MLCRVGPVGRFGDGNEHRELIASEARERVLGPHRAAQTIRDVAQHAVADRVAVCVVDELEAIEVDKQHREALVFSGSDHVEQACLANLLKVGTIVEPRECVGLREFD